jgi:hypothetical protein
MERLDKVKPKRGYDVATSGCRGIWVTLSLGEIWENLGSILVVLSGSLCP